MKQRNIICFCFAVFIFLFCSCTSENMSDFLSSQKNSYIDFHFSKAPYSRINIDDDNGGGEFEEGDTIVLYSYNNNSVKRFRLTKKNGHWRPNLTVEELGGLFSSLNAFYPVDDNKRVEGNKYHEIPLNQSKKEDFMRADLLGAHYEIKSNEITSITMSFSHLMFRVNIDCSSLSGKVTSVQVRGKRKGHIQLYDGALFLDTASDFEWITPYTLPDSDDKKFAAILFPMENKYDEIYKPKDLQIRVSTVNLQGETTEFHYEVPEKHLTKLESGKSFTIKLYRKGDEPVDEEFANRQLWVYGIDSPVSPGTGQVKGYEPYNSNYPDLTKYPRNEWFYYTSGFDDAEEYQYILWEEGHNWFDCDKTFKTDGADDEHLCWAASASNMLHWWMYHNRDYIALYDKKYPNPSFKRPSADFDENKKSEIFNFFINAFIDRGSSNTDGINWFLTGFTGGNLPGFDEKNPNIKSFKGFFPEVLGKAQDNIATLYRSLSKEKFNKIIKDALKNNKAIGYDVNYKGYGNHAMIVWGAEFDKFGNVSYLYTCDNDNRDNDPGAMCRRQPIIYKESDDPYEQGEYTFIISSSGYPNKIIGLHTLGLEQEKWENWKKTVDVKK